MPSLHAQIVDLWDFDDLPATEAAFRARAEAATDAIEGDIWLTQVARSLGLQGSFGDGHELLDRIDPEAPGPSGGDEASRELVTRRELERGRLYRSAGDLDAARPHFERAADLTRPHLDTEVLGGLHVDALHMLALLPEDFAEQARLNRLALEVARSSADPWAERWQASLWNNLGCALADDGRRAEAREAFGHALTACEQLGDPKRIEIAQSMIAWIDAEIGTHSS